MIHICEVMSIKNYLKNTFLFSGIEDGMYECLIEKLDMRKVKYSRTEIIYSPKSFSTEVGFILSGECEIRQHASDSGKVILNTLHCGDSFGILAAFGKEVFPTEVYAKKNSEILFITSDSLTSLIRASSDVALNVIHFLSERVVFLNKRIEAATLGSVDKKLASYLLNLSARENTSTVSLNFKRCSETISAGRASVYRSIESLKNKGYIEAENKFIKILDKEKLEDFIK